MIPPQRGNLGRTARRGRTRRPSSASAHPRRARAGRTRGTAQGPRPSAWSPGQCYVTGRTSGRCRSRLACPQTTHESGPEHRARQSPLRGRSAARPPPQPRSGELSPMVAKHRVPRTRRQQLRGRRDGGSVPDGGSFSVRLSRLATVGAAERLVQQGTVLDVGGSDGNRDADRAITRQARTGS